MLQAIANLGGWLLMMGQHDRSESLFYYFRTKIRFLKTTCYVSSTATSVSITGAGALSFKQFAVFSYSGRVSPHAEIGYESNGKSILAGNVVGASSNTKGKLPDRFIYVVGADASIFKRLTAAFDLYGQRLYGAPEVLSSQFVDFGKCSDEACTGVAPGVAHPILTSKGTDLNILDASIGAKIRLIRNLVATGNVLLKLNDSGLRARVVPLAGISYSF